MDPSLAIQFHPIRDVSVSTVHCKSVSWRPSMLPFLEAQDVQYLFRRRWHRTSPERSRAVLQELSVDR